MLYRWVLLLFFVSSRQYFRHGVHFGKGQRDETTTPGMKFLNHLLAPVSVSQDVGVIVLIVLVLDSFSAVEPALVFGLRVVNGLQEELPLGKLPSFCSCGGIAAASCCLATRRCRLRCRSFSTTPEFPNTLGLQGGLGRPGLLSDRNGFFFFFCFDCDGRFRQRRWRRGWCYGLRERLVIDRCRFRVRCCSGSRLDGSRLLCL